MFVSICYVMVPLVPIACFVREQGLRQV
uniref:Uncharacterized protein n=1 Tax=Anguilla anguilla TaxID=7936 RepID=A0A0E9SQY0_ANGAN